MTVFFNAPDKDPDSILIHSMSWADWLVEGEIITDWSIFCNKTSMDVVKLNLDGGKLSWRVSGGILKRDYKVTVRVVTSMGRQEDRSIIYRVRER